MKKGILLNSEISAVIARMGHTDLLVIGDCGLPIPDGVLRIDLALTKGTPGMLATLRAVLTELQVEAAVIAEEMREQSPQTYQAVGKQMAGIALAAVPHEEFKRMTQKAKACIRTGECTPYANIILQSGVTF